MEFMYVKNSLVSDKKKWLYVHGVVFAVPNYLYNYREFTNINSVGIGWYTNVCSVTV